MRKLWRLALEIALKAFSAGSIWLWLVVPPHQINQEALLQIQDGMTRQQVEKILGVPAGNYSYGGWAVYFGYGRDQLKWGPEWVGDQIAIQILINKDTNRVVHCVMGMVEYPKWSPGWLRNELRLWLGLESKVRWG